MGWDKLKTRVETLRLHEGMRRKWSRRLVAGGMLLVALVASHVQLHDVIQRQVEHRLLFEIRRGLMSPELDPRIKVFNFDDRTAAKLQSLDIGLDDWARVLKAIDGNRPAGIFIDKLFDRPDYPAADRALMRETLASMQTPVSFISFVAEHPIPFRTKISRTDLGVSVPEEFPDWLPAQGVHYGTHPELAEAVPRLGHAVYDNQGFVKPLLRDADGHLIPHWSLTAAKDVWFADNGSLNTSSGAIPVDSRGRILVNQWAMASYSARALTFLPLVMRGRSGKPLPEKVIAPGDYVVILPAMFTGHSDWRETPLGSMPGGYIMTAMLDSVLRGNWLVSVDRSYLAIFLAIALAFAILRLPIVWFVSALIALTLAIPTVSAILFCVGGVALPFAVPTGTFTLTSLALLGIRLHEASLERVRMEKELETAQLVQTSFFPETDRELLRIWAHTNPSTECGGDWWSSFAPRPGVECVIIADATGHGVSAALVTAMAYAITTAEFNRLQDEVPDPAEFLRRVNTVFCASNNGRTSLTMLVAVFDFVEQKVRMASAAHAFPLLLPASTSDKRLKGKTFKYHVRIPITGSVLGIEKDADFTNKVMPIRAGDRFMFFSDGIYENPGETGEAWGVRKFRRIVEHEAERSGDAIGQRLVDQADDFLGSRPPEDDVTLLVIEVPGASIDKVAAATPPAVETPPADDSDLSA